MAKMKDKTGKHPPSVLDYHDYSEFFHDYYHYKKSIDPSFSYPKFARIIGLKRHNYIIEIIQNKRKLPLRQISTVTKGLKFKRNEADHFELLVQADGIRVKHLKANAKNNFFYEKLIIDLMYREDFSPDPMWISSVTGGVITKAQARKSIACLLKNKLVAVENSQWVQSKKFMNITIDDKEGSDAKEKYALSLFKNYHEIYTRSGKKEFDLYSIVVTESRARQLQDEIKALIMQANAEQSNIEQGSQQLSQNHECRLFYVSNCSLSRGTDAPGKQKSVL